eukprot:GSMAST32.ASY1.ANO1.390.1 assembled CDS
MDPDNTFTYKLVLLGETAVGKSSLVMRFVKDEFNNCQESTIGGNVKESLFHLKTAFFTQKVNVERDTVKFEIWDTAGQERYQSLAPMYYRNAKAAIVVYDITDMASFEPQEYTSANNMVFLETSAKTNKNVTELFSSIAVKLPRGTRQGAGNSMGSGGLPRPRLQQPQRKKGCC